MTGERLLAPIADFLGSVAAFESLPRDALDRFAIEELGPPPCRFSFITLGSEGREEKMLYVDQDNGIIFEDGDHPEAPRYFANLGALVCTWLASAGYSYCNGNVMAVNPDWCQPLSGWCNHFTEWVREPEPMAVMHTQIFFDFRAAAGDPELADGLRDHLLELMGDRADIYFRTLVQHQLKDKPPIGFFRDFTVISHGEHKDRLDIKKVMNFAVDFARIFALQNGIRETNTVDRLTRLGSLGVLEDLDEEEIIRGYAYMMSLRLHHQIEAMAEGEPASGNYIDPYALGRLDREILKTTFKLIGRMQRKLSMRFVGIA